MNGFFVDLYSLNWIKAAWLAALVALPVVAYYQWSKSPAGQYSAQLSEYADKAEALCERLKLAADNGRERIAAQDMCAALEADVKKRYRERP